MVSIIDLKKLFTLDETKQLFSKHDFNLVMNFGHVIRFDKDSHVGYALRNGLKYRIVIYKRIKNNLN